VVFGRLLYEYRRLADVSQEELAKRANLSHGYVGLLESGWRQTPKRKTITALARALGLTAKHTNQLLESAGHTARHMSREERLVLPKSFPLPLRFSPRDQLVAERLLQIFATWLRIALDRERDNSAKPLSKRVKRKNRQEMRNQRL
jgi:transcriptional regulator with XRE-family HTH domain